MINLGPYMERVLAIKEIILESPTHKVKGYLASIITLITTKSPIGNTSLDPNIIIQKKLRSIFLPFMVEKMLKSI